MATYYVRVTGDDGDDGTTPALAWATIGKALGAAGISSGDTVYIGAGVYREVVTVAMTSAVAETKVIGDVLGAYTGDAGDVVISAYTTNDDTQPADPSVTLNPDGRDYLTFEDIVFMGGYSTVAKSGLCVVATGASTNIVFTRCSFIHNQTGAIDGYCVKITTTAGAALNWAFNSCAFCTAAISSIVLVVNRHTADYDLALTISNCLSIGSDFGMLIDISSTGSGTGKAGGATISNCTVIGSYGIARINDAYWSTTYPLEVYNCICEGQYGLQANAAGQIVENYNAFYCQTPRTNVSIGANSKSNSTPARMWSLGLEAQQRRHLRPIFTPLAGCTLLNFGDDGSHTTTTDFLGRPRPAGGGTVNAIGYVERHDTAAKETSVYDVMPGIKIVGRGDQDIFIPVDAAATTISIKARYDTNHDTTNKPQAILLAAPEIGVSTETETMTAAVDTWETLTFTEFTPTAAGWVTVRLVSRSAATNGIAYFDTVGIA